MNATNFVFGYGSLVHINNLERYLGRKLTPDLDFIICGLNNFRRCWNVAMDNSQNLPNYKYYRDRASGNRPGGFVTFLNIRPAQDETILGILFRVSQAELKSLDRRERNYQRIEIASQLNRDIEGRAWTYIGLEEAKQRYQAGLRQNRSIIASDYLNSVARAYASLGDRIFNNYLATTDKPKIPILDLQRCRVNEPTSTLSIIN
ncbi:MAG: gamma-glutamylcyclotransferase family protein [Pleurocapsa sp. MO_226.B13]|nr:gamma-glutamylcyclotransferase family protein [Pleurocapsa sp. MO_226.B13]